MITKLFLILLSFLAITNISNSQKKDKFIDARDSNEYTICKIGSQTWMCENLKYKTDGVTAYDNNNENVTIYGYLYDWEIAKKVCPKGWHLPSEDEWSTLIKYLGGKNIAGGKLKSKGTSLWKAPNRFGLNTYGFNALPSGVHVDGEFKYLNEAAYYWSSVDAECTSVNTIYLTYKAGFADKKPLPKTDMACIRCLKD